MSIRYAEILPSESESNFSNIFEKFYTLAFCTILLVSLFEWAWVICFFDWYSIAFSREFFLSLDFKASW